MEFAMRFGWTPEQVERIDPDYLDELIARMNADADIEADNRRKAKRKGKRPTKRNDGLTDEDADIADIT